MTKSTQPSQPAHDVHAPGLSVEQVIELHKQQMNSVMDAVTDTLERVSACPTVGIAAMLYIAGGACRDIGMPVEVARAMMEKSLSMAYLPDTEPEFRS